MSTIFNERIISGHSTKSGMVHRVVNYNNQLEYVTSEFLSQHPLRKEYGISTIQAYRPLGSKKMTAYDIYGDMFNGKSFKLYSSDNKVVQEFFKKLKSLSKLIIK